MPFKNAIFKPTVWLPMVYRSLNSPGLGQGRVRSRAMCFWHWFFTCSEHVLEHLQWEPIQTAFPNIFLTREQWKQIRATCLVRAVVSCLRSPYARRPLWEPLDMTVDVGGPLFLNDLRNCTFLKHDAKWACIWHHKSKKIHWKTKLETKEQNMLSMWQN